MASLKEILARESERSNLRNTTICVALVLVLVIAAFVIAHTDFTTPKATEGIRGGADVGNAGP